MKFAIRFRELSEMEPYGDSDFVFDTLSRNVSIITYEEADSVMEFERLPIKEQISAMVKYMKEREEKAVEDGNSEVPSR